jgi:serpin B
MPLPVFLAAPMGQTGVDAAASGIPTQSRQARSAERSNHAVARVMPPTGLHAQPSGAEPRNLELQYPNGSNNRRGFLLGGAALAALHVAGPCMRPALAQTPALSQDKISDDTRALTTAFNASGRQLFVELAKRSGNVVLSPYSIGMAMAMALSGARGSTEKELAEVLMQRLARPQMERASGEAMAILARYDTSSDPRLCPAGAHWTGERCQAPPSPDNSCRFPLQVQAGQCVGSPTMPLARLLVANALMLAEHGDLVSADYRALVRDRYGAEIFTGASLAQINDWVKQKTEGKIDKIVDTLGRDPVLVLLNAVYFKAAWSTPFAKHATRDDVFHLSATARITTPTMHHEGRFAVLKRADYRAIQLAYSNPALAMIVVLPDQIDGLAKVAGDLSADALDNLVTTFSDQPVNRVAVALPRFKAALEADLIAPFRVAGLKLALSDSADFTGITGRPMGRDRVKIGQIRHRAVIEVLEEGTEAAAATAIVGVKAIGIVRPEPPTEPFTVDHPFLFFIVDQVTRAALFQGRIVQPSLS